MAIEIWKETTIPLAAAVQLLPARRQGKPPTLSCIYRWTAKGYRGVVLERVAIGGTRCTSREALSRFFQRISQPILRDNEGANG